MKKESANKQTKQNYNKNTCQYENKIHQNILRKKDMALSTGSENSLHED